MKDRVYDNGIIREEPYWWLKGFSKIIMLTDKSGNMVSQYDDIYFRTEEDAHKYAKDHGLKENEYCVAICKVQVLTI